MNNKILVFGIPNSNHFFNVTFFGRENIYHVKQNDGILLINLGDNLEK